MSIIFGINLSSRIYLEADTKLSYYKTHSTSTNLSPSTIDNLFKIEDINIDLIIAATGSFKFAKYLISNLKKEEFISNGINDIKECVKPWVANQVDKYLTLGNEYIMEFTQVKSRHDVILILSKE